MTENVMLKSDSVLSSTSVGKSSRSQDGLSINGASTESSFSAEFNKQVEAKGKSVTVHDDKPVTRASHTEIAKAKSQTAADNASQKTEMKRDQDGKKLPQSDKSSDAGDSKTTKHKAETKTDKVDSSTAKNKDKQKSDTESSSNETTVSEVAQTVVQKPSTTNDNAKTSKTTDNVEGESKSTVSSTKSANTANIDSQTTKSAQSDPQTKKTTTQPDAKQIGQTEHRQLADDKVVSQDKPVKSEQQKKASVDNAKPVGQTQSSQHTDATSTVQVVDHASAKTASDNASSPTKTVESTAASNKDQPKSFQHRQLQTTQVTATSSSHQQHANQNSVQQSAASISGDAVKAALKQDVSADSSNTSAALRPDIMHAISKQRSQVSTDAGSAMKTVQTLIADGVSQHATANRLASPVAATTTQNADNLPSPLLNSSAGNSQLLSGNTGTSSLPGIQSSQNAAAATLLDVQPNMQSAAWARVLSSRVVWMAKEGIQRAQIKLNPNNLGPVEVRLHLHNDQASVTFVAHHAATRDALEQALPKLRDSFMDSGLSLANAEVSQQHSGGQSDTGTGQQNSRNDQIIVQATDKGDDIINEVGHNNDDSASSTVGLSLYA